ncbi:MAG: glycosyltransferase [Cyanobacteria bacterium P01_A01_bin.123]
MHPSQPSRIALYARVFYGGGVERVLVNLMKGFLQRGFQVDLVLNTPGGPYTSQIPPEVRLIDLDAPRMANGLPKLIRYLRQEKPQILLASQHYTNEIAIAAKLFSGAPTRVFVSEHNAFPRGKLHQTPAKWAAIAARLTYPFADGVIAVSRGVAHDLATMTGFPESEIKTIYNPIITPALYDKAKAPLDHPWFQPEEPPIVLGIGRLMPQKDFPTLLSAFAKVRQVQPARLVILGNGREQDALQALAQDLGIAADVALLGFVENPFAYLKHADVFVLSSAWEGLGNVLVEALALQVPVVSTDCEFGPAEVLDHGQYGTLVPVGDSDAIAEAVLVTLRDRPAPADSQWLNQFTLEPVTQQYLETFGLAEEKSFFNLIADSV